MGKARWQKSSKELTDWTLAQELSGCSRLRLTTTFGRPQYLKEMIDYDKSVGDNWTFCPQKFKVGVLGLDNAKARQRHSPEVERIDDVVHQETEGAGNGRVADRVVSGQFGQQLRGMIPRAQTDQCLAKAQFLVTVVLSL